MGDVLKTQRWQRVRARQLARRPLCETCDQPALDVHHIVARAAGGAVFDPANLKSLCRPCHSRVTAKERTGRAYIAAGCGPDGYPRDPAHPFNVE